MSKNDLIMFGVVALAAASGVAIYGWLVIRFADDVPFLADSAAAFNSPLSL